MDRYTKLVLTVIAGALVALVAQNAIQPSVAAGGVQKVAICDEDGVHCAQMFVARSLNPSIQGQVGIGVASILK